MKRLSNKAVASPPSKAVAVRDALIASAKSSRKRESIQRVWDALESMRLSGISDFRIADVAQRIGAAGPKVQSIRNVDGAPYRELIAAYSEEVAPKNEVAGNEDDRLLFALGDPALAARVGYIIAQNKALRRRNDILHMNYSRLTDPAGGLFSSTPGFGAAPTTAAPIPGSSLHPSEEKRAVAAFLRDVEQFGWSIDEDSGSILDGHGNEIAGPYFVDALRRIIGEPPALLSSGTDVTANTK